MQRLFSSFIKNGKERKDWNVYFEKNGCPTLSLCQERQEFMSGNSKSLCQETTRAYVRKQQEFMSVNDKRLQYVRNWKIIYYRKRQEFMSENNKSSWNFSCVVALLENGGGPALVNYRTRDISRKRQGIMTQRYVHIQYEKN